MQNDFVITFHSTHATLKAKKDISKLNIPFELIATPREISSECGFCLLIYSQKPEFMDSLSSQIPNMKMYVRKKIKGVFTYEKIY
jgi:hypothetical protein